MSYGDFSMQIKYRGANAVVHSSDDKTTQFDFEGKRWLCADEKQRDMTRELSDGYEMKYCLTRYCSEIPAASV